MRHIILAAAFVLAGSSAMASSILPIEGNEADSGASIVSESCSQCPPPKVVVAKKSYVAPELKPGTQTMEIREINGEKKVVRTEAWMGGSPVVFISKATPEALAAAGAPTDGVDPTATAAVTPGNPPAPLDTSGYELRLK